VLCRGIRSYGKFVIVLGIMPFIGLIVVCSKFLSMINFDSVQNIFPATDWQDFFLNYRSWVSAAQETFLTWALLGISTYSMYCKSYNTRPTKTELRRDALIVVLLTIFGLLLGAILGSSCVQILNQRNYFYFPGSYGKFAWQVCGLKGEELG
jgi:solute carrier family 6 (neurotransmitter transporter), invertebrate